MRRPEERDTDLSRRELVALSGAFADDDAADPHSLSRADLRRRVRHASSRQDDIRRRAEPRNLPAWLTDFTGRAHVGWEDDWLDGAAALVLGDGERTWELPAGMTDGDVLLTVLGTDPALVVSAELVSDEGRAFERIMLTDAIPWDGLAVTVDGEPVADTTTLDTCGRAIDALVAMVNAPHAVLIDGSQCFEAHSAAHVLKLLQDRDESTVCGSCDEPLHPADSSLHHEPLPSRVELQDLVDEASLLCVPCHRLLHFPTLDGLRRRTRPSCPRCGLREMVRPIVWGLPSIDDASREDVMFAGCVVPAGVLPTWSCDACDLPFASVSVLDGDIRESDPRGLSRSAGGFIASPRALCWYLGARDLDDAAVELSDDEPWTFALESDEADLDIRYRAVKITLAYPFTVREFHGVLEDLTSGELG
ncbi:hypothetical protein HP550_14550 [Cellulomonas humilata]|uniref:Uncharacterized protein n=1 Tax=Cellulomonas humilata TaxID=144055 RepID=A0A7Y6DYX9_9CELL|nr:hypothetical protein [Cellulomonas humilata]NUU18474.1 hypothetical protein [Cellulomonas humilata]